MLVRYAAYTDHLLSSRLWSDHFPKPNRLAHQYAAHVINVLMHSDPFICRQLYFLFNIKRKLNRKAFASNIDTEHRTSQFYVTWCMHHVYQRHFNRKQIVLFMRRGTGKHCLNG